MTRPFLFFLALIAMLFSLALIKFTYAQAANVKVTAYIAESLTFETNISGISVTTNTQKMISANTRLITLQY